MLFFMLMRVSMVAAAAIVAQTVAPIPAPSAAVVRREDQKIAIWVYNWCPYPLTVWEHQDGGCDERGTARICKTQGGLPITIGPPDKTSPSPWVPMMLDWESDEVWETSPRALKISRTVNGTVPEAPVVFKYGLSPKAGHLRWAFTAGDGFVNENIRVKPFGAGFGNGDCKVVRCAKNEKEKACSDGLRSVVKPHMCESYGQLMYISLCMSDDRLLSDA